MYLGPALMYSMNLITLIILILYRMIIISPQLTMVVLIPLPVLSLLIYRVSHRINYKSGIVQNKLSLLTNSVQEAVSGIRLVKSFVKENEIINDFKDISTDYMNRNISLSKTNSIFFPLVLFLVGFSILLTIYFGGLLLAEGKVTVGEITEFIIYVNMLTWPATSIGWVTEVIQRAAASQTRINEFLNKKDFTTYYLSSKNKNSIYKFENSIDMVDVSYRYTNSNKVAVHSINFHIEKNNIVGFVGHVGSGKSTILKILAGLITPSSGSLFFDNQSSNNFNWDEFRNNIAYVSQNIFLFSDSIRNNILFGLDAVDESKLLKISKNVSILEEIKSFNQGFDTHIGEGGVTLSGGQKQRIALARALLREPEFLVLDDALSNVDSETELRIINYLKSLRGITIILTSNRLSLLSQCNQIFVLKSGEIIQEGTHLDLIKEFGEYQKLFINQMLLK
ncbi:MAG: ABC transporter [Flavobacteriales bacterium]|nr:ABC transporter [Flavobacteriales bacterium]